MISGIVSDGHAIIAIPFRIPNRADFPIEFVVDTGFTDELCLPPEAVALLNLPFKYSDRHTPFYRDRAKGSYLVT
ncbi:MAG: hypothetical protein SAJ37_21640 [Oscillatoria sp. PMC 1068.18]|nr:hypothetical protein [Oscillatoria sp. PMC 1068.18]